jgi:hypothetical protein
LVGYELTLLGITLQLVIGKEHVKPTVAENASRALTRIAPLPLCPDFTTGNAVGWVKTKSGLSWTTSVNDWVFDAGAPATVARIVMLLLPGLAEAATSTVSAILTGEPDVGLTALLGLKLHVAPAGNPEQVKLTVPENAPAAVVWNEIEPEVVPRGTDTLDVDGAVSPKSTTCKASGTSCVVRLASLPTSCRLKA